MEIANGQGRARVGGKAWGVPFIIELRAAKDKKFKIEEKANGFIVRGVGSDLAFEQRGDLILPSGEIWTPEGGLLKTTLTLDKKPACNAWAFDLTFPAGTRFAFQGELTRDEQDGTGLLGKVTRPDWCINSYAVFDASDAKIAHIPRPFALDDDGRWTWASIAIADGVAIVSLPNEWLEAARYPVTIDPTFGMTSVGGGFSTYDGHPYAWGRSSPATAGTTSQIYFYGGIDLGGYQECTLGLWADDGANHPGARVVDTAAAETPWPPAWISSATDSAAAVDPAINYWIGGDFSPHGSSAINVYFDVDVTKLWYRDNPGVYVSGAVPDPFSSNRNSFGTYRFSAYVVYDEGEAGGAFAQLINSGLVNRRGLINGGLVA